MHAGQYRGSVIDVPKHHGHMLLASLTINKAVQTKHGPRCREIAGAGIVQLGTCLQTC